MSIKDIVQKIKWFDVSIVVLIILVCSASFGVLKLYNLDKSRGEIQVKSISVPVQEIAQNNSEGLLVGSKSGKKYHLPTCPGAFQIAEKNKIWFNSYEEAHKARYTAASNCKELK